MYLLWTTRQVGQGACHANIRRAAFCSERERFFIDTLLVRIHLIRLTGLAPWKFEFPFQGNLVSTILDSARTMHCSSSLTSHKNLASAAPLLWMTRRVRQGACHANIRRAVFRSHVDFNLIGRIVGVSPCHPRVRTGSVLCSTIGSNNKGSNNLQLVDILSVVRQSRHRAFCAHDAFLIFRHLSLKPRIYNLPSVTELVQPSSAIEHSPRRCLPRLKCIPNVQST